MIKKYRSSLYGQLAVNVLLGALFAFILFRILSGGIEEGIAVHQEKQLHTNQQEVTEVINSAKRKIKDNNYTIKQASAADLAEGYDRYIVTVIVPSEELYDDVYSNQEWEDFESTAYIYRVEFADGVGFITISRTMSVLGIVAAYLGALLLCIIIFALIPIFSTAKVLRYVKNIDQSVQVMEAGNLLHQIPIRGQNELARLATSINNMAQSLYVTREKELFQDQEQKQLIANMSHDLRTPMTSMIASLDMLKECKNITDEDRDQCINIAYNNSIRLEKLIDNLFVYTKLTSKDIVIHPQAVELCKLIHQTLALQVLEVKLHEPKELIPVYLDMEQFNRVIDNLFNNIDKYGVADAPVHLTIGRKAKVATIRLSNQTNLDLAGKTQYLFRRSYTGFEERPQGSSGLGLAIVHEIIKQMDGTVTAFFRNGCFTVSIELPLATEAIVEGL